MNEEILAKKITNLNKIIAKVDKNRKKIEKQLNKNKLVNKLDSEVYKEIKKTQESIRNLKKDLNNNNDKKPAISYKQKKTKFDISKKEKEVDNMVNVMNRALEYQDKIFKLLKTNKLL